MNGTYVCLCSDLLHVWSVGRPADCSDCGSPDACGGTDHGTSRGTLDEAHECVCECTERFTGKSCDVARENEQVPFSPGAIAGLTLGGLALVAVLCFFVVRAFREDRAVHPQATTGSAGAEVPAVDATRRTRVDSPAVEPEGLAWANWAEEVQMRQQVEAFFHRRQSRSINREPKLRIESIVKVENVATLSRFQSAGSFDFDPLRAHRQRGGSDTLLFHGCPKERGLNIQATGLLLPYAGNGMLGRGLYGAPDPRKSAHYCRSSEASSEEKFMFICRFRLDASAKHAGPSTQHRNTIFDEFCVYDNRHVVVLWMLDVKSES